MSLSRENRWVLERVRRYRGKPLTVLNQLPDFVPILLLVAPNVAIASAFAWDRGHTGWATFFIGLFAGAGLALVLLLWRVARLWPTYAAVIDFDRIDALLQADAAPPAR